MHYFKHSELVTKYHVSLKTVHNWIDATKSGKIQLELYENNGRTYISNNPFNIAILVKLSENGKKYRNTLHHKVIQPKNEFYETYSRRQILDIITSLDVFKEIPRQYNYMEEGAVNWDNWLKRLLADNTPNLLKSSIELLHANLDAIDRLTENDTKINIIDLGVGNAFPVKELLEHLLGRDVLHRYIAIDISKKMLSIAEQNVNQWFDGKVNFEGHVRDVLYERFDDLLVEDMLHQKTDKTINLVLLLGATPTNFRSFGDVFKVIYGSMSKDDLLIYTDKLDTEASRNYFDFSSNPGSSVQVGMSKLSASHKYVLDVLNIDEGLYDVEAGFDERQGMRYIRVRIKTALTIKFNFEDSERIVTLEKGDAILLLRVWHLTALEIIGEFERTGLMLLQSTITNDRQYFLSISGVESKVKNSKN